MIYPTGLQTLFSDKLDFCDIVNDKISLDKISIPQDVLGVFIITNPWTFEYYIDSSPHILSDVKRNRLELIFEVHKNKRLQQSFINDLILQVSFLATESIEVAIDIKNKLLALNKKDVRLLNNNLADSDIADIKIRNIGKIRRNVVDIAVPGFIKENILNSTVKNEDRSSKIVFNGKVYKSTNEAGKLLKMRPDVVWLYVNNPENPAWYYYSDMFERPVIIKNKKYKSVDEYSKKTEMSAEIALARVQSNKDFNSQFKWR